MFNFVLQFAAGSSEVTSQAQNAPSAWSNIMQLLLFPALFVIMYLVLFRPQKKRQKQEEEMRKNIQIGDEITTIGGIVGKVVNLREDSLVIETGADRNKLRVKRWAVQSVDTEKESDSSK